MMYRMQWCHWWHSQHHVMPTLMPMASHDLRCHVAPHFDYLELSDAVVPLKMPWTSTWYQCQNQKMYHMTKNVMLTCETDTSINDITYQKKWCCTFSSWLNGYNCAIDSAICITWCWCQCQQCQMTENPCLIPFWSSWTNICNVDDDASNVILC